MTLQDPCPDVNFSLKANPFSDSTYVLRDPEIGLPWVINGLVENLPIVDCGAMKVTFFNDDVGQTLLDITIFEDASNNFKVKYNEDVLVKGTYPLTYQVEYVNYGTIFQVQTVPFTVTIIDPCDEPVSVTPAALTGQEYTITQASFDYQTPVYTADPVWCAITYDYSIATPAGDAALTFDPVTRTFSFSQDTDLSLSGATFTDYTITVTGQAGNITPVQGQESFSLRLKNPCIDPTYVTIAQVPLVNQAYDLYDFDPTGL